MLAALPAPRDARGMWLSLSRNQRMALGFIGIAAIVVVLAFVTMSRPAEYQVAFANLRDEDAAAIATKLKEAKIPYELAEKAIKVPPAQVQEAKLLIASSGVVKQGGGAGFEIFAQPHFGLTEFAEKINYQRALEGELGRSIGRMEAVELARVHLTLPEQSLFVSQKKDPTAAAVIELKQGRKLDEAQVQGVVQLIAGSVEGLKAEGVTVMDTAGNVLSQKGGADADPARKQNTRVDIQRTLEQRLTDEVRTMLTPLVGPDKAVVRVNADLDWDQYEANSETFSPNQKAPQVRSRREIAETNSQGTATAGGVPGAERNVPGYPGVDGGQTGNAQNDKRDVTTNYELSRTVEKTVRTPGAIRRLNVAVALDSEVIADPAQADAISRLVATAAGLDTNRGDLVTLTSLPFNAVGAAKPAELAEQARQREMMLSIARMVAMVLGPLLVVGMIWMVLRRSRPKPEKPEIKEVAANGKVNGALTAEQQMAALPKAPEIDPEQARIEKELQQMAKLDPQMMATLIRSWMAEDKLGNAK